MTRRLLLTLLLLAVVAPSLGGSVVVVRRAAGGGSVFPYTFDFSADPTSNGWSEQHDTGIPSYNGTDDDEDFVMTTAGDLGTLLFDTAMASGEQCVCYTLSDDGGQHGAVGLLLRAPADPDASGDTHSIIVIPWFEGSATSDTMYIAIVDENGWSCDVAHASLNLAQGGRLCAQITGTGAWVTGGTATAIRLFYNQPSDDCTGTTAVSYTNWAADSGSPSTCLNSTVAGYTDSQSHAGIISLESGSGSGTMSADDYAATEM